MHWVCPKFLAVVAVFITALVDKLKPALIHQTFNWKQKQDYNKSFKYTHDVIQPIRNVIE